MAFVQAVSENSGNVATADIVLPAVAAGSTIVVAIRYGIVPAADNLTSISDDVNAGNYAVAITQLGQDESVLYMATKTNVAAGTTTITVSMGSSGTIRWAAAEYSGRATASVVEASSARQQNGTTTPSTLAIAASGGADLVAAMWKEASGSGAVSPGTNWTERAEVASRFQLQDRLDVIAGNYAADWSYASADDGAVGIIALKKASVGGGGTVIPVVMNHRRILGMS